MLQTGYDWGRNDISNFSLLDLALREVWLTRLKIHWPTAGKKWSDRKKREKARVRNKFNKDKWRCMKVC